MRIKVVLDAEYGIDRIGHARYQAAERYVAGNGERIGDTDPRISPRWPFRPPVAISWLTLALGESGVLTPIRHASIGMPELGERDMLQAFFMDLAALDDSAEIITWGGVPADMPRLLLAAARHGLRLPPILAPLIDPFNTRARRHLDLMLAMCGGGVRVHLAEVASALGIPAKPIEAPNEVARLIERGKWSDVKSVAESDVYTTSLVYARHLQRITPGVSVLAASHAILSHAIAMEHRRYAEDFKTYRKLLITDATIEANQRWAHAA